MEEVIEKMAGITDASLTKHTLMPSPKLRRKGSDISNRANRDAAMENNE